MKKEFVNAKTIVLGDIVYHESVYNGDEPLKVIGIKEKKLELEGDYSGGTHNVMQSSWLSIEGCFKKRKICKEHENGNLCNLHNLHCQYPDCEPYI